jgi:hypothetical protein
MKDQAGAIGNAPDLYSTDFATRISPEMPTVFTMVFRRFPQSPDKWGTRYRSWLKHYAASQKVAGSIPDEVNAFFN